MKFVDLHAQHARIASDVTARIGRVFEHGRFILGPEVVELEERLADRCGVAHAVTCSSGTDALVMPLMAWGIGPGDAVLVPTFTFAATAEAVALLGAKVVFVDVNPDTFNVEPSHLELGLAEADRCSLNPVGIIAVDLFGQPPNYDGITQFARRHNMWVLGDGAQSFGATYQGRTVGSLANATSTSFFPTKPLSCYGDGGCVFTNDDELASLLRSIRVHGQGRDKYDNVRLGLNGRLDTIQAAVLLAKLSIFDDELHSRQVAAGRYLDLVQHAKVPTVSEGSTSAWAQFTVRVPNRDSVRACLSDLGVPTEIYYPKPLHRQLAYAEQLRSQRELCIADELSHSVLSIPLHPYLSEADQIATVEALDRSIEICV